MRFWDSSAVMTLLVREPTSAAVRRWLRADEAMVAWWSTSIECASALARLRREEVLTTAQESGALALLDDLRASWLEIVPTDVVRAHAIRLLRVHALRAADALQLAAALVWADGQSSQTLVTFDERLARVAALEGFRVLGEGVQ